MTYTLAILRVAPASFEDIKDRILQINEEVGGNQYANMFLSDGSIDLTHIAIQPDLDLPATEAPSGLTKRDWGYILQCVSGTGSIRAKAGDVTALEAMEIEKKIKRLMAGCS